MRLSEGFKWARKRKLSEICREVTFKIFKVSEKEKNGTKKYIHNNHKYQKSDRINILQSLCRPSKKQKRNHIQQI